jgi:hypothetical protein
MTAKDLLPSALEPAPRARGRPGALPQTPAAATASPVWTRHSAA